MADSVDRVFSHALNTVKRIPRTGASRPPPGDRLKLYGLYKQSMEGDVEGVMLRPSGKGEQTNAEREKWDAWNSQKGLSRTEAKRRYISTLIETMHKYASQTTEAQELLSELEFVWDQIKVNLPSVYSSPTSQTKVNGDLTRSLSIDSETPTPTPAVALPNPLEETLARNDFDADDSTLVKETEVQLPRSQREDARSRKWQHKVEMALVRMTVEVTALREQIEARSWQKMKRYGLRKWTFWILWIVARHLLIDLVLYSIIYFWIRRDTQSREGVPFVWIFDYLRDRIWRRRGRRK